MDGDSDRQAGIDERSPLLRPHLLTGEADETEEEDHATPGRMMRRGSGLFRNDSATAVDDRGGASGGGGGSSGVGGSGESGVSVEEPLAIELRGVHRGFGGTKVIQGLDIAVRRGTIYGLLGPSGCGKTTVLNMIIGRIIPDHGTVRVLGGAPHGRGIDVPGGRVGFSPQETALYFDLSVRETLVFHALMQGMAPDVMVRRIRWLRSFLELPPLGRIVRFLSGGQKRRVSLAVAMLHDPTILILDEPTVGLDPMLRFRIWKHLRELAQGGTTVVITTHYIGEAEEADCVGLMRAGCILDVGSPRELKAVYGKQSLEDVFLMLCQKQDLVVADSDPDPDSDRIAGVALPRSAARAINSGAVETPEAVASDAPGLSRRRHRGRDESITDLEDAAVGADAEAQQILAAREISMRSALTSSRFAGVAYTFAFLFWLLRPLFHSLIIAVRKLFQLSRNYPALMFELFIPSIQVFLFLVAIGPDPQNLPFDAVNLDRGNPLIINGTIYGDLYVNTLMGSSVFDLSYSNSVDDSLQRVRDGHSWGVVVIPQYFSVALPLRSILPHNVWVQQESTISLYLDLSNYEITIDVEKQLNIAFQSLLAQQFNVSDSAIVIREAVYGSTDVKFISFLAPGLITAITVSHSIGATALSFLVEKTTGTLDRLFSMGVNSTAMQMGHFSAHTMILLLQTVLMLLVAVLGFGVEVQGSVLLVFFFLILLGGVGMALGLIISTVAHDEVAAIQYAMALFFPTLLLSGILWPVQAIPWWFRPISMALPTTWTAEAMRSIMIRGWGFSFDVIWQALLVDLAWFVGFMVIAVFLLRTVDRRVGYAFGPRVGDAIYGFPSLLNKMICSW